MTEDTMHIKRAATLEWNLNTIVSIVGLVVIFTGGLFAYFTTANKADDAYALAIANQRAIAELTTTQGEIVHDTRSAKSWREELERAYSQQRGQFEANIASVATTANALDDRLDDSETSIARLSDRISASEARAAELSASLRELQSAINAMSGDVKVIFAWVEEQRRANRYRTSPGYPRDVE